MLLSPVSVYAVIGVAGLVILGTVAMFKWRPQYTWVHWVAVGTSVVLGGATFILLVGASHVVRVTADLRVHDDGRLFGSTTERVGDHEVELVAHGSGVTLIINESDNELQVQTLVYGELAPKTMVPPDATIDAHAVYTLHANLDYLGPADRPPSSVTTKGGGKVKYWLTW